MILYIGIFLVSVLISSISQVMLKISTRKKNKSAIREYINPLVISAYFLFIVSTFLTMFAYKEVPLSLGTILETTGYIYIGLLGYFVLKEKLSIRKILGNGIIIIGIIIFTL